MRQHRRCIFLVLSACCVGLALALMVQMDRTVATLDVPSLKGKVTLTEVDAGLTELPGFEKSRRRYLLTYLGQEGVESSFAMTSASEQYRALQLISIETSRALVVVEVVPDHVVEISLRPGVRVCWEVQ